MQKVSKLLLVFAGAMILMVIAFFNGYPLVYSDTNQYINSGMQHFIPIDRPISYGIFLENVSFGKSLWYVAFLQNIIVSYLVLEICQLFFEGQKLKVWFLFTITFLMFFTGIAWYSNQIMPDFFAGVLAMTVFLLFYSPRRSLFSYFAFSILLLISLLVHFSHLLIGLGMVVCLSLFELWRRKKGTGAVTQLLRKTILCLSLIVLGWFLHPIINYAVEKKFIMSKSSHVFIMAHLVDNGMLQSFLYDNCGTEEYKDCKLCMYKDSLPHDLGMFIWESNGVFQKTGWWDKSETEYNKIIKGTLKKPKYIFSHIKKTILYAAFQLLKNEIGSGITPYQKESPTYVFIHKYYNQEINNYINAKQYNFILVDVFDQVNRANAMVNILSFFLIVIIFSSRMRQQATLLSKRLLQFSIVVIIINAIVTAGLNAPSERFQARVTWLVTFALIIFIVANFNLIKQKIKN